ncbi:MAG TPA: type II secretion system F family protein [Candidatus Ozemobacteraceae bacterium]|nr:type II secretion system F family protein [Candidatus Ozemobacteraceae bacterium]
MTLSLITLLKVMAILAVVVGIYLFLEEQIEFTMQARKAKGLGDVGKRPSILRKITGANFEDQLIEALLMINSSLKAGRNLDQAFELVAVSTPAPLCNEFRTLVQERRLGVPMVDALGNLAKRVPSPDLRLAINATIFQQDTGGNLEDLYKQIVVTVAERKRIMGKIIAGTAHARISGNLIGALPLICAGLVFLWNPSYLLPLIDNPFGQLILIASLLASILGLFFINRMTSGIMPDPEDQMAVTNDPKRKAGRWWLIRPLLKILASMNERLGGGLIDRIREELRYLLGAAGSPADLSVNEVLGLQEVSALVFTLGIAFFLQPLKYGLLGVVLLLVLLPIGFYLPRLYLTHLIRRRQQNIEYELPYTIDLLSLSIEAGLDLIGGMQKIVEKSRPTDIVVEFQMFLSDIKFGKSLEEALTEMAERVQVLSFFTFVSSLIQAQRLGAEIGPTLRAQAEQMRYQRMIQAEERVNQLPVKLLIPLVFFVFPSIFVWLIGPSLIYMLRSFPSVVTP